MHANDNCVCVRASNAQALAAAPLATIKKSITGSTMYAHERLLAASHPAVIWQSHLLDVTPASWPSMKARSNPCAAYVLHACVVNLAGAWHLTNGISAVRSPRTSRASPRAQMWTRTGSALWASRLAPQSLSTRRQCPHAPKLERRQHEASQIAQETLLCMCHAASCAEVHAMVSR